MQRKPHRSEPRRILAAYCALAACLATAGHAEVVDTEPTFRQHFADYAQPAVGTGEFELVPGSVDITSIEPPVEIEAAPSARFLGRGNASYYGKKFHGRRTANGESFDMNALTAAHRTLPFGTLVQVTNPSNGKSVTVRINDRGPFHGNRVIDVSRAAATQLGLIARGHGAVELALVD